MYSFLVEPLIVNLLLLLFFDGQNFFNDMPIHLELFDIREELEDEKG